MMKNIIQRNLPLDVKYTILDRKYIPILDGGGCICDNCGKLIANIATVKSENGTHSIGFDCMETFLLNNQLLDGFDVDEHKRVKKMISKIIRFSKYLKEIMDANPSINITGLRFEQPTFGDWITFYYLKNNEETSRDNDSIKLKDTDFKFLIETMKNIFPNLQIIIK